MAVFCWWYCPFPSVACTLNCTHTWRYVFEYWFFFSWVRWFFNNLKYQPQRIIHGFVHKIFSVEFFEAMNKSCARIFLKRYVSLRLAAMNNYTEIVCEAFVGLAYIRANKKKRISTKRIKYTITKPSQTVLFIICTQTDNIQKHSLICQIAVFGNYAIHFSSMDCVCATCRLEWTWLLLTWKNSTKHSIRENFVHDSKIPCRLDVENNEWRGYIYSVILIFFPFATYGTFVKIGYPGQHRIEKQVARIDERWKSFGIHKESSVLLLFSSLIHQAMRRFSYSMYVYTVNCCQ